MDYQAALIVNMAGLSAGTALTWSSSVLEKLSSNSTENPFGARITIEEGSWISSILSIGAIFGPFIFGNLTDLIGRKYAILGANIPMIIGYLLMSFTKHKSVFYIARFLCGLSFGGICNIVPIYVAEITSSHNRGALSSGFAVIICAGMLFSFSVGPYVSVKIFNLLLALFPTVFIIVFLLRGPESPYYFLQKGQYDLAQKALQEIRGKHVNIEKEFKELQAQVKEAEYTSFFDLFRTKSLKKALIIELGLMVFEQFSGIMAVLYYSKTIFKQAGVHLDSAICSIIVGIVQLLASITTPLVIDKLGRKIVLQMSAVGMILSEASLGAYSYFRESNYNVSSWSMVPVFCLIFFTVSYNFGFGPLPWLMTGELFPLHAKASASLFISTVCFVLGFLVAKYFQTMAAAIGMGAAFWLFTINCVISVPFTHYFVIETKGKTLYQIEKELR